MGSPRATFAIPCCDAGPFLEPLLASLLAQTCQDFELLLVDDASTDGSAARAEMLAGRRIRVHRNPQRLGLPGNWNRCAELVRTPFFCLAHMDDVYAPTYLERMLAAISQDAAIGMVHCKAVAIDAAGQPVASAAERFKEKFWAHCAAEDGSAHAHGSGQRAAQFALLYAGNYIICPSALYRTNAFHAVGRFSAELAFAADWEYWFRLLLAGFDVRGVPQALLTYRRHAASASTSHARSLRRYSEERAVIAWARAKGQAAGLLAAGAPFSRALRNNLLQDALSDLERDDADAAREKVRFGLTRIPELRGSWALHAFAVLSRTGALGRAALQSARKAALAAADLRHDLAATRGAR